jgi:hypothetical protein
MAAPTARRNQSRSQQTLRRARRLRREDARPRRNRGCARSWRSSACAYRDPTFGDPRSACAGKRSAIRGRVCCSRKGAPRERHAQRDWDPSKHPRWPAGSPDSVGGRFAPSDDDLDGASADESSNSTRTAQAGSITVPFDAVAPRGTIPWPSEIAPPLGIYPRRELVNPFPDDPECEQEWAEALLHCWKLKTRKQLGRGDNRGSGTFEQCVRGRVTERCGGNPTA